MDRSEAASGRPFIANTAIVFSAVFMTLVAVDQARAQQTDADFSAYCRSNYSNSAYQKFAQSWGTEHSCVQGGTRQGIDLAEACFITTGNRRYQISGARVLCDGSPDDAAPASANDIGEPDFVNYCRDNLPNSSYEKRAESHGVNHYCRRPGATGGFTLQNIDLSKACRSSWGTPDFRIDGARVFCTSGGQVSENASNSGGGGAGGGRPGPESPARPEHSGGPPLPSLGPDARPSTGDTQSSASARPDESVVCQSIGGKWRGGTLTLVDEIAADMNQQISRCADSTDLCRMHKGQRTFQGYMQTLLIFQCHLSFIQFPEGKSNDDIKVAVKEACTIEPRLNQLMEQANELGANLPPLHYSILNQPDMKTLCDCDPDEIPDFLAVVNDLKQQARQELIETFAE